MISLLSILLCAQATPPATEGRCNVIGRVTQEVVSPPAAAGPLIIVPIFDPNVTTAQRAVINQAIADWSGMILSAGQIVNPYPISFVNGPLPTFLAQANTVWTSSGVLTGSTITIDNDGTSSFFVDPTPASSEEFDAEGNCIAGGCFFDTDLLSVMRHEIGHALGWDGAYGPGAVNLLTLVYISGLVFDPTRLNIAMDPAQTNHSDAAVHLDDLMNPSIPPEKRRDVKWYPDVALTARNIDHDLFLRFVDAGTTSPVTTGTADLPWKTVSSAAANEPSGRPFLLIPGTYDESAFAITSAREFFLSRGGTAVIK